MPGYLSLHQTVQTLTIKWTPNQLMNGNNETDTPIDKGTFWQYSLNINIEDIVYVHCHQSGGEESGGTIILVGHDGVQRPPIHFPEGGHMASFLSCLETGKYMPYVEQSFSIIIIINVSVSCQDSCHMAN